MEYELAHELKDAGFPQTGKSCHYWHNNHEKDYRVGVAYIPYLQELIEACGERFNSLHRYSYGSVEFEAWEDQDYGDPDGEIGYGKTPEEAVARLWLELNKK